MQPDPQVGRPPLAVLVTLGLLAACGNNNAPDDQTNPVRAAEVARIVPANEAIAGAHIPTLDPVTMVDAEIVKVIGPGPRCEFRYTSEGGSVIAARPPSNRDAPDGVAKLNGHLVPLRRTSPEADELVLAADRIRISITPEGGEQTGGAGQRKADVVFEVGDSLRAGYRGYYRCVPEKPVTGNP